MQTLAGILSHPLAGNVFAVIAMSVMVLPMLAITIWYHANVGKTAGGRALMGEQERSKPRLRGSSHRHGAIADAAAVTRNMRGAGAMARDISAGVYGDEVRRLQNRMYRYVALWLLANAVVFAVLLLAIEIRQRHALAQAPTPVPVSSAAIRR